MGAGDVDLYDTTQEYGNSMSLLRITGVGVKGYTSSNLSVRRAWKVINLDRFMVTFKGA